MTVDRRYEKLLTELSQAREAARSEPAPALKDGGGSGTSDGMGPWEQSVESRLGQLHGDVRQVLQATIGGFVIVLGALAIGFLTLVAKIDDKTDKISARLDTLTSEMSKVGERVAKLEGATEAEPPPVTAPTKP